MDAYLKLNLGLCDILLTATSACNLLRLRNLRPDGLVREVFQREAFNSVYAQDRVGLNDGKAARDWILSDL
jgi:hypothetical protein